MIKNSNITCGNMCRITKPVIAICGMGENTDKFALQLAVSQCLRNRGYRITQIGFNQYSDLFGINNLGDYQCLDRNHMQLGIGEWLNKIEKRENPDIYVIVYPGGVAPLNECVHNNFGLMPFILSQLCQPDYLIFCLYADRYTNMDRLAELVWTKTGCSPDAFYMSRYSFDWLNYNTNSEINYISLNDESYYGHQALFSLNHSKTVYDAYDADSIDNLVDAFTKKLSSEGSGYSII